MSPYSNVKKRKVEAHFSGESSTSDGGLLLLKEVDSKLGLTSNVAKSCITDPRDQRFVKHSLATMIKQRVYGICMGYEDLNDHENLRYDPCWQATAVRLRLFQAILHFVGSNILLTERQLYQSIKNLSNSLYVWPSS